MVKSMKRTDTKMNRYKNNVLDLTLQRMIKSLKHALIQMPVEIENVSKIFSLFFSFLQMAVPLTLFATPTNSTNLKLSIHDSQVR